MSTKQAEREEARTKLRAMLPPGSTVYTILRHVSRSGMLRCVSVVIQEADGPNDVTWLAARALGEKINNRHDGINMSGCGMDMGFALVYNLASVLYPDGFGCAGAGCPSNDHSNGDRDYTPHPGCGKPDRRGHRDHWHASGGYALRHRWL